MSDAAVMLSEDRPELQKLYLACENIATEGFLDAVTQRTARLSAALADAFRFMTTWDYAQPVVLNERQISAVLRTHKYLDIADVRIYRPVGFKGNLLEYVRSLQDTQMPALERMVSGVLRPTTDYLGHYLGNVEDFNDHRRAVMVINELTPADLTRLKDTEAKWWDAGDRNGDADYGDLFHNNDECRTVYADVNKLNRDRWKTLNPRMVAKEVDALKRVAQATLATAQNTTHPVRPDVLQAIAASIDEAARWVEWYSVFCVRVISLTTALKLSEDKLLKAL